MLMRNFLPILFLAVIELGFCLAWTPVLNAEWKNPLLNGYVISFSDDYGPYAYQEKIIHYRSKDNAQIEATLVTPQTDQKRPGLVFVHMWARDRETWWGLPQYFATYGYTGIYMDLRGHGKSHFPKADIRVTTSDKSRKRRYKKFYLDILPAIDLLDKHPQVKKNELILVGASLGTVLGVLAVEKHKEKFIGMIMMSPADSYFDVYVRQAARKISKMPVLVIAEKNDKSFKGAQKFLKFFNGYKTYFQTDYIGHGTNALYRDLGMPTLLRDWAERIEILTPHIHKIQSSPILKKPKKNKELK